MALYGFLCMCHQHARFRLDASECHNSNRDGVCCEPFSGVCSCCSSAASTRHSRCCVAAAPAHAHTHTPLACHRRRRAPAHHHRTIHRRHTSQPSTSSRRFVRRRPRATTHPPFVHTHTHARTTPPAIHLDRCYNMP
jgi:hypothetical protein